MGYKNWRVVDLVTTNVTPEEEEKIGARINERILIGTFGAMRTNDKATQGYYLVKWITEPYTVQEDTVMMRVEPQQSPFVGEKMCDAVFWNPVPNAIDWHIPISKREGLVMIRLKYVLITGVTMRMISDNNMLPNKFNKKQATNQGAMNIDDDDV